MTSSIVIFDDAGAVQSTYTLPLPTAYGLVLRTFQIVDRGGHEVAMYSGVTSATATTDDGSATIYAYDLTDGVALADVDVRTRYSAGFYQQVDSLTRLTDGSLVACWSRYRSFGDGTGFATQTIRVYDSSNAVVLEYDLPDVSVVGFGFLADAVNTSSVYLSAPSERTDGWCIRQIDTTGSGSILRTTTFDTPATASGVVPFFLTGADRFTPSTDPTPGPFTGEPPIRWRRRTPHMVSGLKRLFFGRTELLVDVGAGGTSNTVTQRYSNDGGQTWSTPVTRSLGSANDTTARVFWPVNGSGRDRVWEWYGDGDAPARVVDCFVEAKEGTS